MAEGTGLLSMKPKQLAKLLVDIGMTVALMLLMAYSLIGEMAHEWIGCAMFALFVIHHVLNIKWCRNLFRGRYTPFRIVQTLLVALMLCSMIGSMVSGIVLSRHVFADLPIEGGSAWARTVHMICAYWCFVFMSLHLGLHWNMMMGMGKKLFRKPSKVHSWIARSIAFTIAAYGVYAFGVRQIGEYMLLKTPFVFFDFDEPLLFFFLDYLAVMGLFVCLGHYGSKLLKMHK